MPNLKDIRRRIVTVGKTQQITKAMRMVAAAKLRRAEQAIAGARPYAERMRETLAEVAAALADSENPLLAVRETVRNLDVVVITSDRGLAGAFNSAVLRRSDAVISEREGGLEKVSLTLVGRKAGSHYRRRRPSQIIESEEIGGWVTWEQAAGIAGELARRYATGETDEIVLIYSRFVSTMTQSPADVQLLPFAVRDEETQESAAPYSFEPGPEELLRVLAPRAVEVEVFRALLENQAGEHAARMTAMESATRNTEELIEKLTLDFNRARQAAITKELVEIVSGAQALEG